MCRGTTGSAPHLYVSRNHEKRPTPVCVQEPREAGGDELLGLCVGPQAVLEIRMEVTTRGLNGERFQGLNWVRLVMGGRPSVVTRGTIWPGTEQQIPWQMMGESICPILLSFHTLASIHTWASFHLSGTFSSFQVWCRIFGTGGSGTPAPLMILLLGRGGFPHLLPPAFLPMLSLVFSLLLLLPLLPLPADMPDGLYCPDTGLCCPDATAVSPPAEE